MKETVSASLASQSFTFEEDAYYELKRYLKDIESRLEDGDGETILDVESRLAEILREKLPSPMMVVNMKMVNEAMAQMGGPSEFGESRREPGEGASPDEEQKPKLVRSRSNRSIAGVCGGIGEFFDIDPTLLRLVTLLLIIFGGLSIWVYIILWIVIPEER